MAEKCDLQGIRERAESYATNHNGLESMFIGQYLMDVSKLFNEIDRLRKIAMELGWQESGFQERGRWDRIKELEKENKRLREVLNEINNTPSREFETPRDVIQYIGDIIHEFLQG